MPCSFLQESVDRQTMMDEMWILSTNGCVKTKQEIRSYSEPLELSEMEKLLLGFLMDVGCVHFPF